MDIEQLNKTPHNQICDLARDKFIEVYNQKFGEGGEVFFEEQKALFNNELLNGSFKGYLEKATSLNIHDAFMNLAINGLSLEKGTTTLCYLMGYSNYDKNTRKSTYTAKITYTGYGEILLRQRAGQILRCDNPVVVYDCDDFRFGERDGHKFVDYVKTYPRPANSRIVACYVKIILPNNSYDYFVLDLGHLFVNNKPSYSSEIEENDAKDIMNGAYKEISASLLASYKQTVTATRDELLMKFDSKIAELLEIKKAEEERKRKEEEARKAEEERKRKEEEARKAAEEERKKQEEIQRIKDEEERKRKEAELKAAEEERKRKEAELKAAEEERKRKEAEAAAAEAERKAKEEAIRKADEAAKEEQQRKLAAEQEKRDAENAAQHATAQAQSLFAQTSVGNTSKQKIKVTKRLVVTDKNAWLDIIQQWWTIEGSSMSPDKLASKLEFMRKACEKHANNEEEYIVSPYIKYEDEVTAK